MKINFNTYINKSDEEKLEIKLMLLHGIKISEISINYGVGSDCLTYIKETTIDNVRGVFFGSKSMPYYTNEMEYGQLELKYDYENLKDKINIK